MKNRSCGSASGASSSPVICVEEGWKMTIGIAAHGPNAGLAVFAALRAVEKVGSGCIGGFVSFAAIAKDGNLMRSCTQRGGTATLFIDGDLIGADPPSALATAPIAALMSSGPDRPEPLAQFVAGEASVGLVTGHRFAHQPGNNGIAFNQDALRRMRAGMDVASAVNAVIAENSGADVGLIAIDLRGRIHARNSERVDARPDLGSEKQNSGDEAAVSILHNAIHPAAGLASLAADVAMEIMLPTRSPDFWIQAVAGTPVVLGESDSITVDSDFRVIEVRTTDASLLRGRQDGAAIYIGSEVRRDGKRLGYTTTEPYVVLEDGMIESLSGQHKLRVGCRQGETGK